MSHRGVEAVSVVRLLGVSFRAEGWLVNHKKIQRLWREEGLPGNSLSPAPTEPTS